MKCKWKECENDARSKSPFCSGTCKKRDQRASGTDVSVKVGQDEVGQIHFVPVDGKVYGRQAVSYETDQFETRPEPLNPDDQPVPRNRGRYTRADGTVYQFDACGKAFECVHKYKHQRYSNEPLNHLAIYRTADEVRELT